MNRGYTLAESAVALALLGMVLVLVLNLFPRAMLARRSSEQKLQALSLARGALEAQMEIPLERLYSQDLGQQQREGVIYSLYLEVRPVPQQSVDFLLQLRLSVGWSFQGRAMQLERRLYRHRLAHQQPSAGEDVSDLAPKT